MDTLGEKRNVDIPNQILEQDDPPDYDPPKATLEPWGAGPEPATTRNMQGPGPRGKESDKRAEVIALQQLAHNALANVAPAPAADSSPDPQPTYDEPRRHTVPTPSAARELPFRGDGQLPPLSTSHSSSAPGGTPSSASYPPPDYFQTAELISALNPTSPSGTGTTPSLASPRSIDPRSPTASLPPSHQPQVPWPPLAPGASSTTRLTSLPSLHQLMGPHPPVSARDRPDEPSSYSSPFSYPAPLPRRTSLSGHHQGTPPVSPNGSSYTHDLPSPRISQGPTAFHYPTSKPGPSIASPWNPGSHPLPRSVGVEYGAAGPIERTPSTDHSSLGGGEGSASGGNELPVGSEAGTFKCTFKDCTAKPFQTQYLLNSHANVHSSARPHYCPVYECPRSKPGQGFKRKNEMIRHGFVHESPGYACPFCPDREHKYPRPDNLQRCVLWHA